MQKPKTMKGEIDTYIVINRLATQYTEYPCKVDPNTECTLFPMEDLMSYETQL